MSKLTQKPELTLEELEQAFEELAVHFDRTVSQLEHATRLIAKQGSQYGEAIAWLHDIRRAAGATQPGTSHRELCEIIRDLRRRAFMNDSEKLRELG